MTGGKASFNLALGGTVELLPQYAAAKLSQKLDTTVLASLAYGVDTGRFNLPVLQTRPLQAGASEVLNLYDGSLVTVLNESAPFRLVRWFVLWVVSGGDAGGVTVGANGSNDFAVGMGGTLPTQTTFPGGLPVVGGSPAGLAVDATHKNVKVVNNGAALVNYGLAVFGTNIADPAAGTPMGSSFMPLNA